MRKTLLFFPLLILIAPAVIYIIEQGFKFISKSSAKMDALHQLIIQSKDDKILERDNSKLALEVIQAFHNSSSFSKSYLLRTVFQTIAALCMILWLILHVLHDFFDSSFFSVFPEFIYCNIK